MKYFTTMRRLLIYYYRLVYKEDDYLTRTQSDQTLLGDVIQYTIPEVWAISEIVTALDYKVSQTSDLLLKHTIR